MSTWRTSSYSGSSDNRVAAGATAWRASSYSGSLGNCVEVGTAPTAVVVRDTKNRSGVTLAFPAHAWHSFATTLKRSLLRASTSPFPAVAVDLVARDLAGTTAARPSRALVSQQ